MRQLPPSSECSHEEHDAPKVLRLDHLHRVITTNSDTLRRRREGSRSYVRPPYSHRRPAQKTVRLLLFAWIISRIDVIDRPRANTMDLKDGLFLGPSEMVHFRLHNRDAAGRYTLGLAGIELVSHADVKGARDYSYVLDRGVRV